VSSPAPEGGTTVSLKSDRPDIVGLPETVTILAKAHTARFSIITHITAEETAVRISVAVGELGRSNTLMLYPLLANLTLSPTKVKGGASVVGTVSLRQRAGAEGIAITLSSGNPALTSVPSEVSVPAGTNSATFPITTRAVSVESSSVITASGAGAARTATLTLVP
jgi:hypothetical protein